MGAKFPFPTDPEKWQAAYTADNAYYDAGPISRTASFLKIISAILALTYGIVFLFSRLPTRELWFVLDEGFIVMLDKGELTDEIREAFLREGFPLGQNAALEVESRGDSWIIIDGNKTYFVHKEKKEPRVYHKPYAFTLDIGLVSTLDSGQVSAPLRLAFENQGKPLDAEAKIKVKQLGASWVITDGEGTYYIDNEQQNIKVYEKKFAFIFIPLSLKLLRTNSLDEPIHAEFKAHGDPLTNDATIKVEEPGKKWVIYDGDAEYFIRKEQEDVKVYVKEYCFDLDSGTVEMLNAGQLTISIQKAFEIQSRPLAANATVKVEKAGEAWLIEDTATQHFIRNEKKKVNVYAKKHWFNFPDKSVIPLLDLGRFNNPIQKAFRGIGKPLAANATVNESMVEDRKSENEWVINDGNAQYFVLYNAPNLTVERKKNGFAVLRAILLVLLMTYVTFKALRRIAFLGTKKLFTQFRLPPESIDPAKVIKYRLKRRIKLPMPFSELFPSISQFKYIIVKDGQIRDKDDWVAWMGHNIGGPILLVVSDGSALYIERGNRFSRIVGPGTSFLERYETIKYAVDLRAKTKMGDLAVWTKDGIVVKLKARIEYRIGDPHKVGDNPRLIYPYSPADVKQAVERYALRWPDTDPAPSEFTWEDAAWGQVTAIVPGYIGSRFLDDLLVADRHNGQILSPDAANEIFEALNKATNLFGVYITDFQILSIDPPPEVKKQYVEYWEAEKQSLAIIMDGKAKAFGIRAREKARAEAQQDIILKIADGLRKNEDQDEVLLLSLSKVLDNTLSDPYIRSYVAKEALETLEKLKNMLEKPRPPGDEHPDSQVET